jgi:hypothetical protein
MAPGCNIFTLRRGKWAGAIQKDLRAQGFALNLAVGFTRFGSYAVAKRKRGLRFSATGRRRECGARRAARSLEYRAQVS